MANQSSDSPRTLNFRGLVLLAAIVFAVFGGPTFGLISGISNQDYSHLPPDMQPSWTMNVHLAEWIPAASNALWFDKSNPFLGPELATIVWCNIGNIASLIFMVVCTLVNFVAMLRNDKLRRVGTAPLFSFVHISILLIVATLIFYDMYAGGVIYDIATRMRFGTLKGDLAWVLAVSGLDAVLGILFVTAVMGLALQAKSILQKNSSRCHPGESRDP